MFRRYRLLKPDDGSNPSSATPQAGNAGDPQPQAGSTTSPTPQAGSGKTPEDYERMLADLRKENAGHRTKLKKFEDDEAARTQAQMTEQEKLQQERDELQASNEDLAAELLEYRVNQDVARFAGKLNFTLSPDLLAKLLDWSEIEWDEENGKPLNIEKLLEQLAKSTPDIVKPEQQQQPNRAPAVPAMNPGRSSIVQPGQPQPGRIPRLHDRDLWKH